MCNAFIDINILDDVELDAGLIYRYLEDCGNTKVKAEISFFSYFSLFQLQSRNLPTRMHQLKISKK